MKSGIQTFSILLTIVLLVLAGCKHPAPKENTGKPFSEEDLVRVNKYLVEKDHKAIRRFIERQGWKMQQTATGLWYEIIEQGHGPSGCKGCLAVLSYRLSLLDGTPCYNSDRDGPKEFIIGQGGVESGLEEAILLLHQGDSARLILPPYLAHGLTGDQNKIPGRASLVYEIRVLRIIPAK
ncbi:MAG: peptidylprolyl isomerase [Bacteroidales bacterium]|nr:peptidylprolyl isomerase [Bacteroidales bacterium]